MTTLLLHNTDVSRGVRDHLEAAFAEPDRRDEHLTIAARLMHRELALDCSDARELVGLPAGAC